MAYTKEDYDKEYYDKMTDSGDFDIESSSQVPGGRFPDPRRSGDNLEVPAGLDEDDDNLQEPEEVRSLDDDEKKDDPKEVFNIVTTDSSGFEHKFEISKDAALLSGLFGVLIEEDPTTKSLPLEMNIKDIHNKSIILSLVIQYLEHHAENGFFENNLEEKATSTIFKNHVKDKFDVDFIENRVMGNRDVVETTDNQGKVSLVCVAKKNLYDLITVANYMEIEPLLHLGCLKVASMLKSKSEGEIAKILSVDNPYGLV